MLKQIFTETLKTIRALVQEGNPLGSSKRLIVILSFVSAIGLNWYCVVNKQDISDNQLYLSLAIIGTSTGNYLIGNRKSVKEDSTNG